ncbi:MAG: hypothetical protein AB8B99_11880 [Phormidesmis sp.]
MSKKRNSVFSGVVPVLGASQTTAPISLGAAAIARYTQNAGQNFVDSDPTVRYSTGSTLLDSFVQAAEYDAFALQSELTALSFELKRIANPRLKPRPEQNGTAAVPNEAVRAKRQAIMQARQKAQRQAQKALQQVKAQRAAQSGTHAQGGVTVARNEAVPAEATRNGSLSNRAASRVVRNRTVPNGSGANGAIPKGIAAKLQRQVHGNQVHGNQVHSKSEQRRVGQSPQQRPPLAAAPSPSSPQAAPAQSPVVKVYGGADYKAMQARAQAGGLVNLDDSLLFGGAENSAAKKDRKAASISLDQTFLVSFSEPLEDFTASPIPGGWHPTAHLDASELAADAWQQTVLDIDSFKLNDLSEDLAEDVADPATEENHDLVVKSADLADSDLAESDSADGHAYAAQMETQEIVDSAEEMAALNALGKQVSYLNRRIEFLSKKLAEITTAETDVAQASGNRTLAGQEGRSSVVLALDAFELSEGRTAEKRLATLEPLVKAI